MATIRTRKRADGSTYVSVLFRLDGRQSSISFDDRRDAEYARSLIETMGARRAVELLNVERGTPTMTVREYLDNYVDHLTGIERGTLARYRSFVENDISPHFGAVALPALSSDDVSAWINRMVAAGASGKTVKNKRDFLSGALKAAVQARLLTANPCVGVRAPRWDRAEMVFLNRDEFRALKAAVAEYWRPLVEFLVASGCRWSEATALRPTDVDRLGHTVRITRAWKTGAGGYQLGVPKTRKSVRTINVPATVLDQLDYSGEWLFTNSGRGRRNGGGPVRAQSFSPNVWHPAVARADLGKTPRIHDLRHTCASWLIQAGVPLPVVQQHLGHESIETTVGVYGHLDRRSAQQAADAIGEALA